RRPNPALLDIHRGINTQEFLAAVLRPGSAGSNTAADHITVLTEAINQVPVAHRRKMLVRADGAGASHDLVDWLTGLNTAPKHGRRGRAVEYSVGFAVTQSVRDAITLVPKDTWSVALDADGDVREHADVVEITGLLPATIRQAWPADMRVIIRREHPHPGAQLSLFEAENGWRYQAFATNTQHGQVSFLEARHRAHARVEDRIRVAKDTGLGRFPSLIFSPPPGRVTDLHVCVVDGVVDASSGGLGSAGSGDSGGAFLGRVAA
ncbi:MAG TPA: transposase, partial [Phycicoccus sp.]|nr:transposase [Phycicoccus sp.]